MSLALAAGFVAALALGGCGRKGPLDLPPGDAPVSAPQAGAASAPQASAAPATPFASSSLFGGSQPKDPNKPLPNAFDSQGNPIYQAAPNKPFVLDPLLH